MKDTGKELQIVADVPGMSKDDIKVQVRGCQATGGLGGCWVVRRPGAG